MPLANVLELDTAARKVALRFPTGCLVSTDFATAFPATDQGWILRVMAHAEFPAALVDLARASLEGVAFLTEELDPLTGYIGGRPGLHGGVHVVRDRGGAHPPSGRVHPRAC